MAASHDDGWRGLAPKMPAERSEIGIDGCGVSHDEPRNESKDRIVDRAYFGDRDATCRVAVRLDLVDPPAAVRQPFVSDAPHQPVRRLSEVDDHRDDAMSRVLAPGR